MGTTYAISLYAHDARSAQDAFDAAFDEIDRVDDLLSNYKPTSELSRINREAAAHEVITDPETFAFLQVAFAWSAKSHGAFDITVGRLLRTWGFFEHHGALPSEEQQRADAAGVGWRHVKLNAADRSVRFVDSNGLELDPGSIGKGYAVDRVVELLRAQHVTRALISAGSSTVYALGAPPSKKGWPVRLPDPRHAGGTLQTLTLTNTSISTGACTEKFFVQNGHRYCHIFDPRTLRPVEDVLLASVISPSATDSDALSTAVFVLSPAESKTMLADRPEIRTLRLSGSASAPRVSTLRWSNAAALSDNFRAAHN